MTADRDPRRARDVERICQEALDRPAEERAAYLADACGSDVALQRDVESLLAQAVKAERFIERPALERAARDLVSAQELSPGQRVGPYEVTARVGEGGMGVVYRARDTVLGRDVALKVLPPVFQADPDREARFDREARVLATLNHPHIATIYGVQPIDGSRALVLEYVEGPTLRDVIAGEQKEASRGLDINRALAIAAQLGAALEAAHAKGIVHRDLKPANIKITPDGTVKVLDFGLAKAMSNEVTQANAASSPTLSLTAARHGMILGTAAYMAPEQARGAAVDKRADIWAFGCVLYEMLTGRPVFTGDDVSTILARVLERDPDFGALPADVHPVLGRVLQRCLHKEARLRYHDVGDVRLDLEPVRDDPHGTATHARTPHGTPASPREWVPALLATALAAGVAGWLLKPTPGTEPPPVVRFEYGITTGLPTAVAVSPDGRQIAYAAERGLFVRSVDQTASRLVAGTEGPTAAVTFSPDGEWLAYRSGLQLLKIVVAGGRPVLLADLDQPARGLSWSQDDRIVWGQQGGIMSVSANGGIPVLLLEVTSGGLPLFAELSPDEELVFYTLWSGIGATRAMVASLSSGESQSLFAGNGVQYVAPGYLVYVRGTTLFAQPFDLAARGMWGEAIRIAEGVGALNDPLFDVSETGTLAYVSAVAPALRSLVWVARDGTEQPIRAESHAYVMPRISPDGTRVALWIPGQENDIHLWDFARETLSRFTFTPEENAYPVWTPDGQRLAFFSSRSGAPAIYWSAADGTGNVERILDGSDFEGRVGLPYAFSATGTELLFERTAHPDTGFDIGLLPVTSDTDPVWLLAGRYNERGGRLSPNGKWLAYQSDESERWEVYVRPFPNVDDGKWQISNAGGVQPVWSTDGTELFFLDQAASRLMAVAVETSATFTYGRPRTVIDGWTYYSGQGHSYDVWPDGQRFLAIKDETSDTDDASTTQGMTVVVNWLEELRARVPVPPGVS